MDPSLVGTHQQPAVAYRQAIALALDLRSPLFYPIGCIIGLDGSISTHVQSVSAHREPDGVFLSLIHI